MPECQARFSTGLSVPSSGSASCNSSINCEITFHSCLSSRECLNRKADLASRYGDKLPSYPMHWVYISDLIVYWGDQEMGEQEQC